MQKQNQSQYCHLLVWHKDKQLYKGLYNTQTKQFIVEDFHGNLIVKLHGIDLKRYQAIKKHLLLKHC